MKIIQRFGFTYQEHLDLAAFHTKAAALLQDFDGIKELMKAKLPLETKIEGIVGFLETTYFGIKLNSEVNIKRTYEYSYARCLTVYIVNKLFKQRRITTILAALFNCSLPAISQMVTKHEEYLEKEEYRKMCDVLIPFFSELKRAL